MSSEFGNKLKISIFGESHGEAIGVVVDGLPAGETIDFEELQFFMERRRGGKNAFSTSRSEVDAPEFQSGIIDGKTSGTPLCAVIKNNEHRSVDYAEILDKPRPGHADYTAYVKWGGKADMRGGGHFSGRLTAPLCVAGGIAKQILKKRGIYVGAHLDSIAGIHDARFDMNSDELLFDAVAQKDFPVIDDESGNKMKEAIINAKNELDSVGGVIECMAIGVPAGLGEPMFDGIENRISQAIFGIPAIKGIEFGAGFAVAEMRGSENNDSYEIIDSKVKISTNNAGGILGGITNGNPILFRVAVKPTPSISKTQKTISFSKNQNAELSIKGRHDPCIAQRAVPVVEAVAAIVILDEVLNYGN